MSKPSKFEKFIINIYQKNPRLRPLLKFSRDRIRPIKPGFSGWGMTTVHQPPWKNHFDAKIFLQAAKDIKNFKFNLIQSTGSDVHNVDESLWRHWIISYAARYVIEFSRSQELNFVECGVGEGHSAFFCLREITNREKSSNNSKMHLYDAWAPMRKVGLLETELNSVGKYSELTIDMAKNNLKEFEKITTYHQGYIPDSFQNGLENPNSIIFLHIDLNSAKPTLAALEFFFSKLEERGIILFDDYGAINYLETRKMVDEFFKDKKGILMELPTGQAIYYK